MKSSKTSLVKIFSILCVVLMLGMLVLQFVPFWEVEAEDPEDNLSVSISSYIWFPGENDDLTDYFEDVYKDNSYEKYNINSIVLPCVLFLVLPVIAAVFFAFDRDTAVTPILTALCGVFGVWAFLAKPVMRYGSLWVVYFVLSIVLILAAVASFVFRRMARKAAV